MIDPSMMMGGLPPGGPPPPAAETPPPNGGGGGSFDDLMSQARDLVSQAESVAEDDEDRETVTKALAIINKHFADVARQKDAALGVTPVHKGVRRTMRRSGGGAV